MTNRSSSSAVLIPSPAAGEQDAAVRESPVPGSYILVVDDEAVVRAFVARCLEAEGYVVKHAGSAAETLELMLSSPAAAVLCDIRLPGQDGLWLAERIHAHWPQIPIVMVTAVDDVQTVQKSRDVGAVDYIPKPIRPHQLVEVLRRVTARAMGAEIATPAVRPSLPEESRRSEDTIEAEYALETQVRCPACGERIEMLKAVRLIRARVNFTSTLPRRGRVVACPHCLAIVPAELTNF